MSDRSTDSLLRDLARGLDPVRPIPRARSMLALLLAGFGLAVVLSLLLGSSAPFLAPGVAWGDPAFLGVFAGLILAAAGGLTGALLGAIPGREREARFWRGVAVVGALLASGSGIWAVVRADLAEPVMPLAGSLHCGAKASILGSVPAGFLTYFLGRAFEPRPLLGAGFAAIGALALGALVVHASCPDSSPLHMLVGHWIAPFAMALILALPLALILRRQQPPTEG